MTPFYFIPKCLRVLFLICILFFFEKNSHAQTITTYAGGIGDDSLATTYGRLIAPVGVAIDGSGNMFISDQGNFRVRKVNASGYISTIAGNGLTGTTSTGSAVYAEINPEGVIVDVAGNVYIATGSNVLKLNTAGNLSIVAGNSTSGYSGDGGPATAAQLNSPQGLCVDAVGDIFIADEGNARIRKVNTSGIITTIAGGGSSGIGDGGPATAAAVDPYGVAVDAAGNVYIADQDNERIRKVNTSGIINTIAGTGTAGYSGDGGAATAAELYYPYDVKVDAAGNIFLPDKHNQRLREINGSGIINTIAGTGTAGYSGDGGPATAAKLDNPSGIALDASGNVYIADLTNNRIRMVSTSGIITTVAGNNLAITGYAGDGGNALLAEIGTHAGVVFDGGDASVPNISVDNSGNVYITDWDNQRIRKITPSGIITTVAGNGSSGFSGDGGPATAAKLYNPAATAVDKYGNIFIADYENNRIRKVDTSGIITTYAGGGIAGLGDGGPATLATISAYGVAVDTIGNVYIADAGQHRVRKVDPSGIIATIAGDGTAGHSGDGGPAISAEINMPNSITVDKYGNIFISDLGSGSEDIRKVNTSGIISTFSSVSGYEITSDTGGNIYATSVSYGGSAGFYAYSTFSTISRINSTGSVNIVAGNGIHGYMGDNGLPSVAEIGDASGVAADKMGNLYILQQGTVRKMGINNNILTLTHGASQTINVCESSGATNIDSFLTVTDPDTGHTVKWYINTVPTHGTLSGFADSMLSTGGSLTPSGLTYTPTTGYSGTDNFKIAVVDGTDTVLATIAVTISVFPTMGSISGPSAVCTGSTIILSETTSGGTWSSSNTAIATTSVGSSTLVTGISAGTAIISYTQANACGTVSATHLITVNLSPATITGITSVCVGSSTSLTDLTTGGIWSSSNTLLATVSSTGVVTGATSGEPTITYALTSCYAIVPVTVNALPNAGTISGAPIVCTGYGVPFTDAASGGAWSSSNTTVATVNASGLVTGIAIGTATIRYTVVNTCGTAVASYTVTVNTSPPAITGITNVCVGATTVLTDVTTGGTWTSSNTSIATVSSTGVVTGVTSGVLTITYTTPGCYAVVPVTVNALPNAGAISGGASVCIGSTISLTDTASGGAWTSSNTAVATVSISGLVTSITGGTSTISYMVTNACGIAYATKVITVNISASTGTITGPSAVCTSSSITLSDAVVGGAWTSSDPYIALGSATGVVVGLAPGTATVYYTITNSCGTASTSTIITVDDPPNAGTITGSTIMCVGGTDPLGDAVSGGTWSTSTPSVVSISGTGVVSGLAAGAGVIYYTVANACGSAEALTIVNVDASTPISYITGPSAVCTGSTIALSDATVGGTWSSTDPAIGSISTTGVVTGITPGITTISYTANLGCGLSVATAEITIDAAAYAGTISGSGAICIGADALLSASGTGGVWAASNTNASISATGVITGVAAGTDIITYTVTNSCGSAYTTFITTVYPAPMAGTITGSTPVCSGSSISLTDAASGGIWSSGNSAIATVNTSGLVSGISGGTVAISYTVSNGCGFASATAIVTVNNASAGTISGITSLCAGSTTALTDAVAGGSWSSSSTSVATISSGGLVNAVASGTTIISYQVTGTCGTAIATMAFVVDPLPSVSPITGTTSLCISATSTLADGTVGGIWSSSNTAVATVGSSSGLATGISAGTCIISYALASGCGTSFAVVELSVAAPPSAGTVSGTTTLCAGNTTSLTDAVTGGVWSSSAPGIADVSGSGVVTGIASGTATILYTVSNFCGTATATLTVNVNAASAGTITGITDVCTGSTSQLTDATGGGVWSSSSTAVATITSSGLVNAISGGTTIISYGASGSCGSAVTTAIFTVGSLPVVPPLNGSASVCSGSSTTLTDGTSGGAWNSSNTLVATVNSAGMVTGATTGTTVISYTVTAGCGATTVFMTITVNAPPSAGTISGSSSVCQSAAITLTDGFTGGIWSSSNAAIAVVSAGGVVTGIDTGAATISYTISNSCGAATATLPFTVLPAPYPGIITGNTNICVGAVTTLSDNVSGGTWTSFASTIATVSATGLVTGLTSGADVISYTVSNSCGSNSATIAINIDPLPDIAAITGATVVSIGGTTDLYDAISGGSWSSSNTSVATVNGAGIVSGISTGSAMITYTMINGFGCTDDTSILITVVASTGINNINVNNGYKLSPNPATNEITITWQNQTAQTAEVVITDMVGREVLRKTINLTRSTGNSLLSLSAIQDGTYIVTITSPDGCYTGKLVIIQQ